MCELTYVSANQLLWCLFFVCLFSVCLFLFVCVCFFVCLCLFLLFVCFVCLFCLFVCLFFSTETNLAPELQTSLSLVKDKEGKIYLQHPEALKLAYLGTSHLHEIEVALGTVE